MGREDAGGRRDSWGSRGVTGPRREVFLGKMDELIPWERLERRIEPYYPKAGGGRRPYPLRSVLRVHCGW